MKTDNPGVRQLLVPVRRLAAQDPAHRTPSVFLLSSLCLTDPIGSWETSQLP